MMTEFVLQCCLAAQEETVQERSCRRRSLSNTSLLFTTIFTHADGSHMSIAIMRLSVCLSAR